MKKFQKIAPMTVLLTVLVSCGTQGDYSLGKSTNNSIIKQSPLSLSTVNIPYTVSEKSISDNGNYLISDNETKRLQIKGDITTNVRPGEFRVIFLTDENDNDVALDVFISGKKDNLSFNSINSAKAYLLSDPLLGTLSTEDKIALYDMFEKDEKFQSLVDIFKSNGRVIQNADVATITSDIITRTIQKYGSNMVNSSASLKNQRVTSNFNYAFLFNWNARQSGTNILIDGNSLMANDVVVVDSMLDTGNPFQNKKASGAAYIGAPNALTGRPSLDLLVNFLEGKFGYSQGQSATLSIPVTDTKHIYNVYISATQNSILNNDATVPNPAVVNTIDLINNLLSTFGLDILSKDLKPEQITAIKELGQTFTNFVTSVQFAGAAEALTNGLEDNSIDPEDVQNAGFILQQTTVFMRQNAGKLFTATGINNASYIEHALKRLPSKLAVGALTKPADIVYTVTHAVSFGGAVAKEAAGGIYNRAVVTFEPPVANVYAFESGLPPSEPTCLSPNPDPTRVYSINATASAPDVKNVHIESMVTTLSGGEISRITDQPALAEFSTTQRLQPGTYPLETVVSGITTDGKPVTVKSHSSITVPLPPKPPKCQPEPELPPVPHTDGGDSSATGDPHYANYENSYFDFQGTGEFILTKSSIPGDTFEVQVRQLPYDWSSNWKSANTPTPVMPTTVTGNRAIALKVGNDRVTITGESAINGEFGANVQANQFRALSSAGGRGSGSVVIRVNGEIALLETNVGLRLPSGGYLTTDGSGGYTVVWKDGSSVTASGFDGYASVSVHSSAARRGKLVGLMGNYDGVRGNDFKMRDGTLIPETASWDDPATYYGKFGEDWRVKASESLFDYDTGESTAKFTDKSYPVFQILPFMLDQEVKNNAENICNDFGSNVFPSSFLSNSSLLKAELVAVGPRFGQAAMQNCILDVALTGNAEMAIRAAQVAENDVAPISLPPALPDIETGASITVRAPVSAKFPSDEVIWTATGGTFTHLSNTTTSYQAPAQPGIYTITATVASAPQYSTTTTVTVIPGKSPVLERSLNVQLVWSPLANDLDLHLWLPSDKPYHIYYGRSGSKTNCPYAELRSDALGILWNKENIQVNRLIGNGNYQIYVQSYPTLGNLTPVNFKGASVTLTNAIGEITTITAPSTKPTTRWWHVADVESSTGRIHTINEFTNNYQPYLDTGKGCPQSEIKSLSLESEEPTQKQSW